eukprot:m.60177 g.60177  ORF g.60177 m.60177 type:complete len:148 (-) comp16070_c0_seq3:115-558(-)
MTFAVVGILGHVSKTMLLFFLPQVFNFVYSVPQLFRIIPCPRHRMPKFNADTGLLEMSMTVIPKQNISLLQSFIVKTLRTLKLAHVKEDNDAFTMNNMTLLNFVLMVCGPLHEKTLSSRVMLLQALGSVVAFTIRYALATLFYDIVE